MSRIYSPHSRANGRAARERTSHMRGLVSSLALGALSLGFDDRDWLENGSGGRPL